MSSKKRSRVWDVTWSWATIYNSDISYHSASLSLGSFASQSSSQLMFLRGNKWWFKYLLEFPSPTWKTEVELMAPWSSPVYCGHFWKWTCGWKIFVSWFILLCVRVCVCTHVCVCLSNKWKFICKWGGPFRVIIDQVRGKVMQQFFLEAQVILLIHPLKGLTGHRMVMSACVIVLRKLAKAVGKTKTKTWASFTRQPSFTSAVFLLIFHMK